MHLKSVADFDDRLQLAKNAIDVGKDVVWIGMYTSGRMMLQSVHFLTCHQDCFQELHVPRLRDVLAASQLAESGGEEGSKNPDFKRGNFIHISCLTLPHLMALTSRPNTKAIPDGVGLIVLSSLSASMNSSLPKTTDGGGPGLPKLGNGTYDAVSRGKPTAYTAVRIRPKTCNEKTPRLAIHHQCASKTGGN